MLTAGRSHRKTLYKNLPLSKASSRGGGTNAHVDAARVSYVAPVEADQRRCAEQAQTESGVTPAIVGEDELALPWKTGKLFLPAG